MTKRLTTLATAVAMATALTLSPAFARHGRGGAGPDCPVIVPLQPPAPTAPQ